jgi:hypothetical protein
MSAETDKVVRLPVPVVPDYDSAANDKRNERLFDWAKAVFKRLGLDQVVAQVRSKSYAASP